MKTKICTKCNKEKPTKDFYKNKKNKDGLFSSCIVCDKKRKKEQYYANSKIKEQQKKWRDKNKDKTTIYNWRHKIKRLYKLTTKEWEIKFGIQKGCCDICGIHQSTLKSRLCVDHSHIDGKVRSLLCSRCNLLVGQLEINPALIESIKSYLEKYNA